MGTHIVYGVARSYYAGPSALIFGGAISFTAVSEEQSPTMLCKRDARGGTFRVYSTRLRRGYKKRPAVSHDRSLILLMVFNKRTRDVNSRMKIRSCATKNLRLPNEPLKSEFEIGCCKYSLSRYFHQNLSDFFSATTKQISFISLRAIEIRFFKH